MKAGLVRGRALIHAVMKARRRLSFPANRRGNVAIIFALSLFPILALTGFSVDYTFAARRQSQLRAAADAAALMTTSPSGFKMTAAVAQTNAAAMFQAQVALLKGVTVSTPTVSVTDGADANGNAVRTTSISFSATSSNTFATLLSMPSITIGGVSAVSGTNPPNTDFYLLLDTSPSMAIPATQDGIDTMVGNTAAQKGCAFACHETNPTGSENAGNPNGEDNYALARSLGLTLRVDLVRQAATNMISVAQNTSAQNGAAYRVATYTFDASLHTITPLTSNLMQAQSDASGIQLLTIYNSNYVTAGQYNNAADTDFDQAMSNLSIPNPGNGSNLPGDTPKKTLFIVTDGVLDETYPGYGPSPNVNSNRLIGPVGQQYDHCTPLKKRGVKIAILYTTYLPLPKDDFYKQYVAPFSASIPTSLQNCASPGLYYEVGTNGDITAALASLFAKAVGAPGHLTQ